MKKGFYWLPAILLLLVSACAPKAAESTANSTTLISYEPPVKLQVTLEEAHYKPGETVVAALVITNTSTYPVMITFPAISITPQDNSSQSLFSQPAGNESLRIKPGGKASFNFTWNQADSANRQVQPGWYKVAFEKISRSNKGNVPTALTRTLTSYLRAL